jgi:hypothetical protein
MRGVMSGGLFCLFLVGLSAAACAAVLGVATAFQAFEAGNPTLALQQLSPRSGSGALFLLGLAVCATSAIAWAILDRQPQSPSFPQPNLNRVMAHRRRLRRIPKEDLYVLVEGNGKQP